MSHQYQISEESSRMNLSETGTGLPGMAHFIHDHFKSMSPAYKNQAWQPGNVALWDSLTEP
jgi:hypothetical protein